jgi:hypothetical protein
MHAAQKGSFGNAAVHVTCLFATMEFDLLLQQPNEYQIVWVLQLELHFYYASSLP